MTPEVVVEIIKIIPNILWFIFISILVARLYEPLKTQLLPRMSGFKAFGIEATFIKDELDKAAKAKDIQISEVARSQVVRRIERVAPLLQGLQVLWVDDNQGYIEYESNLLRSLKINVDVCTSTAKAFSLLSNEKYDLVISDIARGEVPSEGLRFLAEMRERNLLLPTIFYVGQIDSSRGTPPYAFGITNRVDHLLHYVMDIAERVRG